jgi:diketogulonate reductase-like aldo/keto reductase
VSLVVVVNVLADTIKNWPTKNPSYLIHAPFFSEKKEDHQAKWAQMEQVKAAGLARSIGVSNYLPEHLDWILETAQTPPSINQIEFHPYLQHGPLIDYHKQKVSKNLNWTKKKMWTEQY